MSVIASYSKVWALGHREIEGIFDGPVVVQEKIDGSQISFVVLQDGLHIRSKGKELVLDEPEKMFRKAVDNITERFKDRLLSPTWIYRGEYLELPKHNTLAYDRVPLGNIVLFDVETSPGYFLSPDNLKEEADSLGFECVPLLADAIEITSADDVKDFLEIQSALGGQKVEGVVVKNYNQFTRDGKLMCGKYVSEKFKEIHGGEWRKNNPPSKDVTNKIIDTYRTPARWEKSIQHLAERGELTNEPKDIGLLMREVNKDILEECGDEIREILFKHYWKAISRGLTRGLPEWYKERLLESAFEESDNV